MRQRWPETSSASITGRFFARLWDLDCVLELQLDRAGRIDGSFIADGESLEITGGSPDPQRAVCGATRAPDLAESLAECVQPSRCEFEGSEVIAIREQDPNRPCGAQPEEISRTGRSGHI